MGRENAVSKKIFCCDQWWGPREDPENPGVNHLYPGSGFAHLVMQTTLEFTCLTCKGKKGKDGKYYRWFGVEMDTGKETPMKPISADDWPAWKKRIATEPKFDPKTLEFKEIKLTVGEYSNRVHRAADGVIAYLNQLSRASTMNSR